MLQRCKLATKPAGLLVKVPCQLLAVAEGEDLLHF
jgi:hypothetical protein